MTTVTYQDILNQAAEIAGRTRDKLPVKEALMVQGFVASALREVWNGQYQWPELIPGILQVLAAGAFQSFPKAYQVPPPIPNPVPPVTQMGDILGVWTANPQTTPQYLGLRFEDQGDTVWLPDGAQLAVYVEYMLPCPDLNTFNANTNPTLLAYTIPTRFRNFLAWTAAGHLCRADGQVAQGDEFLALAQSEIVVELRRLTPVPRRPVRQRDLYVDARASGAPAGGGQ